MANYNDNYSPSKYAWLNEQNKLILAANRCALKYTKCSAEKSVSSARGKALDIPIGNLVLLHEHPEGQKGIQDNYKSELFIMDSRHKDPNVYSVRLLDGKDPMCMVN